MADAICTAADCTRAVECRGLCLRHYSRARQAGTLDEVALPKVDKRGKHRVSNVNRESRIGDCLECGKGVRIAPRSDNPEIYECRVSHRGTAPKKRGPVDLVKHRAYNRAWRYKLVNEEYIIRYEAQQGRCLICHQESSRLVIDHSHQTGAVRGLLCRSCNLGLGFFRDDASALRTAAKYVLRYR